MKRKMLPQRLLDAGYRFRAPEARDAPRGLLVEAVDAGRPQ